MSDDHALIAHLKLQIEKLKRDRYGPRSERTLRLIDQPELTLEELVRRRRTNSQLKWRRA
ncbi:hypothetical protein GCM10010987_76010 [Bradyrhizobium guangdongense]|uniref:Transposase TnpC homeodomain domain-containing protein n=1 Tax=Bradyrhizobium guangdongense TaxID=1325090 RepID=A0AA87WGC8_9BRAD|nr:hypothetical protein GCM10010987_76010 [Bradyrhizobium guangdongense]